MKTGFRSIARNIWYGFAFFGLVGCGTLSKDECLTANWHSIGYEDAIKGWGPERMGEHRQACAKHGVTLQAEDYRLGHRDGAREFCRPRNGFQWGLQGQSFPGFCPDEMEEEFSQAYKQGNEIWGQARAVSESEEKIQEIRRDLANSNDSIREIQTRIMSRSGSVVELAQWVLDLRDLAHRQGELEEALREREKILVKQRHDLAALKARNVYR